jgi:Flp pilus assembly protein TadD
VVGALKLPRLDDVEPDVAGVRFNTALCYERLGRIREAKEELRQLLRVRPNFPKAEQRLARLSDTQ